MRVRVLKLGTVCKDKATGLSGTLTIWLMGMGQNVIYVFQPKGLDEDGQPTGKLLIEEERLEFQEGDFETVEVPFEILGTMVSDKASGFNGMAVEFIRHINGCFHVMIQPPGLNEKTRSVVRKRDFDLRSCEGEMITQLSEKKLEESRKETPSPSGEVPQQGIPSVNLL